MHKNSVESVHHFNEKWKTKILKVRSDWGKKNSTTVLLLPDDNDVQLGQNLHTLHHKKI